MTKSTINTAQDFLTVVDEKRVYQIVNIELLLRKHPPTAVIAFLKQLRSENSQRLRKVIKQNKTDPEVNELVARNFRLKMAITTITKAMKDKGQEAA